MSTPATGRRARLLLGLLLGTAVLLGAFLRLYELDLMKFGDEEATHLHLAHNWVVNGQLPLVGLPTSLGVNKPAGLPYLLAPLLLLSRHPLVAAAFVALLNVLSILLLYRALRAYFGRRVATLAALLYASSFWAVYGARHVWDQALMAPAAVLVLDRLLVASVGRQGGALGWAVFWAATGILVHPSAVALLAVVVAVALAARVPLRPTALLTPLLLAGLLWAPFLLHLVLTEGSDVRAAGVILGQRPNTDLQAVRLALWQLFPHPEDPLFQSGTGSVVPGSPWLQWLHPAVVVVFLASLVSCAARALPALRSPGQASNAHLVAVLSYIVPLGIFLRHSVPVYDHYLFQVLPSGAIILALGLLRGGRSFTRVLHRLRPAPVPFQDRSFRWALAMTLAFAAGQSWFLLSYVRWLSASGATFGSGVPFRSIYDTLEAATALRASAADPVHVAARPESALLYDYLISPAVVVDQERTLAFSSREGPIVYITVADGSRAGSLLRKRFPESERFNVAGSYAAMMGMVGSAISTSFPEAQQLDTLRASPPDYLRVYLLPPDAGLRAQESAVRVRGPWSFANGLRVEGYDLPAEVPRGTDLLLTLAWTVAGGQSPQAQDQRFFAHLLDRLGHKWAEANELDYPPRRWRQGDRIISWLRVPVPRNAPQGIYKLDFGMFHAESMEPILIGEDQGAAASMAAGPVRVVLANPPEVPHNGLNPRARFGEALELLGYDVPSRVKADDPALHLRLLWRTTQPLATDYTLFVHLLDQQGQMLAQDDGFAAGGLYPTSAWRPGEVVEDLRRLPLPPTAAGQQLTIALGWYRLDTGHRLPLDERDASQSALVLGPVAVGP